MMPQQKTKQHLLIMLKLQDEVNTKLGGDWRAQGYPFLRAAWIEAAELMNHQTWAWWKVQEPDINQMQMEIIDMWHFILSAIHVHYNRCATETHVGIDDNTYNTFVDTLLRILETAYNDNDTQTRLNSLTDVLELTEELVLSILDFKLRPSHHHGVSGLATMLLNFYDLLCAAGLTTDQLFEMYIGKSLLNEFRKDHGYKEGNYIKIWNGREDNEYLHDILQVTEITVDNLTEVKYNILQELELNYPNKEI